MKIRFGKSLRTTQRTRIKEELAHATGVLRTILGAPSEGLGLGGTLELSIGEKQRGMRSTNTALYLREKHRIVIPRSRAGPDLPLAHEWAHALEDHLKREEGWEPLGHLIDQLKHWPWTAELTIAREAEIANRCEHDADAYRQGGWHYDSVLQRWGQTRYARDAAERDDQEGKGEKRYWSSESELLARSFEAWVHDQARGEVPYLVGTSSARRAGRANMCDTAPQGTCRGRANALWDELTRCMEWNKEGPIVTGMPARDWKHWGRRDAIQLALEGRTPSCSRSPVEKW